MTRFLLMPGFYGSSRRSRQSVAGETSGPDRCIETGIGGVRVFTTSVRYRAASNFSLLGNSQRAFRRAFYGRDAARFTLGPQLALHHVTTSQHSWREQPTCAFI